MVNYVVVECECERAQIAVYDEDGEDINLWEERKRQRMEAPDICEDCGAPIAVRVVYQETNLKAEANDEA